MFLSPFVRRALAAELPAKDLTDVSTTDLVRRLNPDVDDLCPAGCSCHGGRARQPNFQLTAFCTPHCGYSQFEDWLHTPKCESDSEAALLAEQAQEDADYDWCAR